LLSTRQSAVLRRRCSLPTGSQLCR
jgi:hypothetical protein